MPTSIAVFGDVILTASDIKSEVKGRVIRKNERVRTASGQESINIVWDRSMREYDIGIKPMLRASWEKVQTIFEITDGGARGFLILDPADQTAGEGGRVASLSGSVVTYQLYKRYEHVASARYKDRKITRPLASSIVVKVNGVVTSATVDETDGTLSIAGSPDPSTVRWTGSFHVPVHFVNDQIDWEMLRPGNDVDLRLLAGPLCTMQEIPE
jgi:uncharacterized protein (TIGR02217 family)